MKKIAKYLTYANFDLCKKQKAVLAEDPLYSWLNVCPLFIESHQKRSTCSQSATDRGLEQKVISYSFYGPLTSAYFNGIFENLAGVKMYYPDYVMRLYLDRLKAIANNQGFMQ